MAPGIRLTRSHISTIHAALNPFHPSTSRSPLLLLSLLSTPKNTTSQPSPTIKGSPSDNVNVTVSILPKSAKRAEVTVGYVDGKVERIPIEAEVETSSTTTTGTGKVYPRRARKEAEAISLDKLVERVDGWARSLKLKDDGSA
ncbi:hypothetical protein HD553DRAFT_336148 [Filobasidium floriforme]|uniref:uncharacterized protein n=1 Tax=Filobasidium floriforme TaxID=5210 RepID=UPI001E8E4D3A|nr:uncharacterized protein HD553DRAFT_336148 [Filobasidium floriforme]KAH8082204.1 hypothetical protein HD553DRAFT_336148 [Filobasidium floriforme]